MFLKSNELKQKALEALDDTTFSNKIDNYERILDEEGFKKVLEVPFYGRGWSDKIECQEKFCVYWNNGLLISFDTFNGKTINSVKLHYNIRTTDAFKMSSGRWYDDRVLGDHDAREALRNTLKMIRSTSEVLNPWVDKVSKDSLWLLHYMDTKDANGESKPFVYNGYNDKITERANMLPKEIQEAIYL